MAGRRPTKVVVVPPGGIVVHPNNKTGVTGSVLPAKKMKSSVVGSTPPMPQRGVA